VEGSNNLSLPSIVRDRDLPGKKKRGRKDIKHFTFGNSGRSVQTKEHTLKFSSLPPLTIWAEKEGGEEDDIPLVLGGKLK